MAYGFVALWLYGLSSLAPPATNLFIMKGKDTSLLLEVWIGDKFYKGRGNEKCNCYCHQNSLKSDSIKKI